MVMTPTPKKPKVNIDANNGSATPAIAVALLALLIIFIGYTFEERDKRMAQEAYDRELHTSQETSAYQFSEQKNRANQMKVICDNNAKTNETLKIWISQNSKLKVPPEFLVSTPCVVVFEKNE